MRILVVEDDEQLQRLFVTLLQRDPQLARAAPELVVATDGLEGLAAIESSRFDLLIVDLLLPKLDGFELCRRLRKLPHGADVPVLVTSAIYRDAKLIAQLEAETRCTFFAKPFVIPEILTAMRERLGIGVGARATHRAAAATAPMAFDPRAEFPTDGSLQDFTPPRLLLEAWERRVSGHLVMTRSKTQKSIALVEGVPVQVVSNLRNETLGHFLVARRQITEEQHQHALRHAKEKNERLGAALVDLGLVTRATLLAELIAQHEHKIVTLLRWNDGEFRFTEGTPNERPPGPVNLPQLLFAGLRRTARTDERARTLVDDEGTLELAPRWKRVRETFLGVFGSDEVPLLEQRPQLRGLLEQAAGGEQFGPLVVQIDTLLICGLATLTETNEATSASPSPPTPAPTAPPSPDLLATIFDPEESSKPRPVLVTPSGVPIEGDIADRVALEVLVLDLYLRALGKNHYQLLDLDIDATDDAITAAFRRRVAQTRSERFASISGAELDKLREIQRWIQEAYDVLRDPEARRAYDLALRRSRTVAPSLDAELRSQLAIEHLTEGDGQGACRLLAEAIRMAPEQPDYHALLGWALFVDGGGLDGEATAQSSAAAAAHAAIGQALALDRNHVPSHHYLATIATHLGNIDEALDRYERLLAIDPWNADALQRYETIAPDPRRVERLLRDLIRRLAGTIDKHATAPLWLRLGELYANRLDDHTQALEAITTAVRLAPNDPLPVAALTRLLANDLTRRAEYVAALEAWWRLAQTDLEAGARLFEMRMAQSQWDRALQVGAALVVQGVDDEAITRFVTNHRPRFLVRAQQPLDAPLFAAHVRHVDDDTRLTTLYGMLEATLPPPFSLAELGAEAHTSIARDRLPEHAQRVLSYVSAVLDVPLPAIHRLPALGAAMHMAATRPGVLLVGDRALEQPALALAFRAARALSFGWSGRTLSSALPARQLRRLFFAAVLLVRPDAPLDDPDGTVAQFRERFAQQPPEWRRRIATQIDQLLGPGRNQLNLAAFARGVARSADRVGFLLCGDLVTAATIVRDEGADEAVEALIDYAVSEAAGHARDALGLSVMV